MKSNVEPLVLCVALLLGGCASQPDHFYTLSTVPDGARGSLATPALHILLSVSVPSIVDRAEMVLNTSATDLVVLDHERWPGTLSDQVSQTLARDLERRRDDVLVGDRRFDQAAGRPVALHVDIVKMSARRGGGVVVEAHWRIVDTIAALDLVGSGTFESPLEGADYAAVARAYSRAVGLLADRLTLSLPTPR